MNSPEVVEMNTPEVVEMNSPELVEGGNIFTWGWGGSHVTFSVDGHSSGGQLGLGDDIDYIEPMMISFGNNVKALQVSCGFNHTAAILEYLN